MKPGWATLIVGLSLLIPWVVPVSLPNVSNGSYTPVWPLPFLFLLGLFGQEASVILMLMIPALFFFAWNPRLFRGSGKVPRRSYALFAVGAVLSLDYFYSAWNEGLRVQGVRCTYTLFATNIALVAALGFMFAGRWKGDRHSGPICSSIGPCSHGLHGSPFRSLDHLVSPDRKPKHRPVIPLNPALSGPTPDLHQVNTSRRIPDPNPASLYPNGVARIQPRSLRATSLAK